MAKYSMSIKQEDGKKLEISYSLTPKAAESIANNEARRIAQLFVTNNTILMDDHLKDTLEAYGFLNVEVK